MNLLNLVFLSSLAISNARPNVGANLQNVVTVPSNCPSGQEWVNGQCREVWKIGFNPLNVISVPPNCSAGQVLVNGQCRDVWLIFSNEQLQASRGAPEVQDVVPSNVITVPPNCPAGQEWVNGQCRDIWIKEASALMKKLITEELKNFIQTPEPEDSFQNDEAPTVKNIISVPNQCPNGYRPDALGVCREILNP